MCKKNCYSPSQFSQSSGFLCFLNLILMFSFCFFKYKKYPFVGGSIFRDSKMMGITEVLESAFTYLLVSGQLEKSNIDAIAH